MLSHWLGLKQCHPENHDVTLRSNYTADLSSLTLGRHGGKSTSFALARSGNWIVKFTEFPRTFAEDPYEPRSSDSGVESADSESLFNCKAARWLAYPGPRCYATETGTLRPISINRYDVKNLPLLPQNNRLLGTILFAGLFALLGPQITVGRPRWALLEDWKAYLCCASGYEKYRPNLHPPVLHIM